MHEWAIAEGVVNTATRIAVEQKLTKVLEIVLQIGELQQIEHEIFRFSLEQLKNPLLRDVRFVFENIPAKLRCRVCGENWLFNSENLSEEVSEAIHFVPEVAHSYIECMNCGSPDFEILEGRGIILKSIRGVK